MDNEKIDFVILWVDGSDKEWLKEKNKYLNGKNGDSVSENRYRDWQNLKYWFRGVEKFAPWVNRVYFVTYGHIPKWLNIENPKLRVITHEEFIPKQYLPTFNSNTIELNLNRIQELSEQFVLFNDDMFIINSTKKGDFFQDGLPKDECEQNANISYGKHEQIAHATLNDIDIINRNFKKRGNEKIPNKIYKYKIWLTEFENDFFNALVCIYRILQSTYSNFTLKKYI